MSDKAKSIPEGFTTVTPHLIVKGAGDAIEFYKKAFGAKEIARATTPDGSLVVHATIQIGDSFIMMNDEFPEMGAKSPLSLNGSPVTIHLYVEDVDALWKQAVDAGAKETMPLQDQFWGDRYGLLVDPFGHSWSLGTHIEDVSPDELEKRSAEFFGGLAK